MLLMFCWTILVVAVASNWTIVNYVHIINTEFFLFHLYGLLCLALCDPEAIN
jgi:hypothetical protein